MLPEFDCEKLQSTNAVHTGIVKAMLIKMLNIACSYVGTLRKVFGQIYGIIKPIFFLIRCF